MIRKGPVAGITHWRWHRLVANYWSLPLMAVIAAPVVALLVLWADAAFASEWLFGRGIVLPASASAANDMTIAIVGADAAFLTLYWSVTLIVLTLATGHLGVRLVDRWLDKGLVRLSMAGLTFCLVFSFIVLARIDDEAPLSGLPHFAILAMLLLQLVNISMLGVAVHDLGRTMFVDRSIGHLGRDASKVAVPVVPVKPFAGSWAHTIRAPREGYVEGSDLDRIADYLSDSEGAVRFCGAPGQHVLKGEPLMQFENSPASDEIFLRSIPIGDFRSGLQSTVYQVRLLVEVAARALSPGINDFYTAIACADRLAEAISGHAGTWVDEGSVAAYAQQPRFELPGQDFRGLFGPPLAAFRQSAVAYPAVTIRMIDNYARLMKLLCERDCPDGLIEYLREQAQQLRDEAGPLTKYAPDKAYIDSAFDNLPSSAGPAPRKDAV